MAKTGQCHLRVAKTLHLAADR